MYLKLKSNVSPQDVTDVTEKSIGLSAGSGPRAEPSRLLLKGDYSCPFNCKYCFADLKCFNNSRLPTKESLFTDYFEADILYPCCDSELELTKDTICEILQNAKSSNALAVSISTKGRGSKRLISNLSELNHILADNGILLKYSISISTKTQIAAIEEGASSYKQRLELAASIQQLGILSSINIKPILPFIEIGEYYEIVDDFLGSTPSFMLGGLYIDDHSEFGLHIMTRYPQFVSKRRVEWLPEKPSWLFCVDSGQIEALTNYIFSRGGHAYTSDHEFICRYTSKTVEIPAYTT